MNDKTINVVIFGKGRHWSFIKEYLSEKLRVTAYMDNNVSGGGVYLPIQWEELEFDKIIICAAFYYTKLEMMNQLLDLGVARGQIGFIEEYQKNYSDYKIEAIKKDTVMIHSKDTIVRCENAIEYMIAQELFAGEEYGFHTKDPYFVIDIGMNIGCASLYFAMKKNVTAVYGFEPGKDVYDKAVSNIALNKQDIRKKIQTYNIALGEKNGVEEYMVHEGEGKSAGIKKIQHGSGFGSTDTIVKMNIIQASHILKDIFSKHEEKCLLKLDCEGAEYGILSDLNNSGEIKRIDVIIMEWHIGRHDELSELLEKAGFHYILNKGDRDFGKCYAWR